MNDHEGSGPSRPGRREFLTLGLGAFAVATLPFVRSRSGLVRRRLPLMGTVAEIGVVHRDERYAWNAAGAALDEIARCERLLTRFQDDSDVGRANLEGARDAVRVSRDTAHVLQVALTIAEQSGGRFDPCLGRAVMAWDVGRRTTPLERAAAQAFARRSLFRSFELDLVASGGVVRFLDPDVSLDLGGIGKGYGVDQAVRTLREWGIRDGLVNVGGDLYGLGRSPEGDPWTVGVRSPDASTAMLTELSVSDQAVATSGDYQQGFDFEGRRYHHILDPTTGAPVESPCRSVTLMAGSCADADAWATAAFGLDVAGAQTLLERSAGAATLIHLA